MTFFIRLFYSHCVMFSVYVCFVYIGYISYFGHYAAHTFANRYI